MLVNEKIMEIDLSQKYVVKLWGKSDENVWRLYINGQGNNKMTIDLVTGRTLLDQIGKDRKEIISLFDVLLEEARTTYKKLFSKKSEEKIEQPVQYGDSLNSVPTECPIHKNESKKEYSFAYDRGNIVTFDGCGCAVGVHHTYDHAVEYANKPQLFKSYNKAYAWLEEIERGW